MSSSGTSARIAVNLTFVVGLAAMAVSEAHACPLGPESARKLAGTRTWPPRPESDVQPWRDSTARTLATRATATIAVVSSDGPFDAGFLRRLVKRSAPEIAKCYEASFIGRPVLKAELVVTFRITATGVVANVAVTGPAATICVTTVFEALTLSRRTDGDTFVHARIALQPT